MKIIDEKYENYKIAPQIRNYDNPDDVLFFDIETTGLNKVSTSLYLIGCGFYKSGYLNTKFFFGDSPEEEQELLDNFMDFAMNFNTIIHFNGTKFDLPYLDYKCRKYSIKNVLDNLNSLDLYKEIKPLRYLLFRESMRQKCVEDFLGIERKDKYNGGELIPIYYDYVNTKDNNCFENLMMHNREDVLGMHKLFPILEYLRLDTLSLQYVDHNTNKYSDYFNNENTEIIFRFKTDLKLPKDFSVILNNIYYKFDTVNDMLIIRVPALAGNVKHYYENYNDYYYLPDEGFCIHKNAASGVDKSLKQKATKDNCYILVDEGLYLPQFSIVFENTCGPDYKTRNSYFPLSCINNELSANLYGKHLLNTLLNTKPKKIKKAST